MTREEYEYIQERLRRKLKAPKPWELSGNRGEGYEKGLTTAMSIIKEIYETKNFN